MFGNVGLGKDTTEYWKLKYGNLSVNSIIEKRRKELYGS